MFRIGDWTVFPIEGAIEQGAVRRNLRPKAMDFLLLLVESPGVVVTKEEILDRLWADTVVEEGALARCVSELRAALDDSPKNPRFIQTRHRRGYRLIASVTPSPAPALASREEPASRDDPASRNPSVQPIESDAPAATTVEPALAHAPIPVPAQAPARGSLAQTLSGIVGGAIVAALVVGFLRPDSVAESVAPSAQGAGSSAVASARQANPRAVVLSLTHLDEDPANGWIGRAVAHLLTTELASTTTLRLVPADVSGRSEGELALWRTETLPMGTLDQLRVRFGVDLVISGHYVVAAGDTGDLRLDLMVTDAATGEIRAAAVEHGPASHLGEIVTLAAMRLREDFDPAGVLSTRQAPDQELARLELPRSYFQGLLLLERLEAQSARERFEHAVTAAPEAAWPRLALAESWALLGYDRNAAVAVADGLARIGDLAGEERLWFEARAHALAADWDAAIERFRALRLLEPDNLEYSLAFIATLVEAGWMAEAPRLLAEIRESVSGMAQDPRLTLLDGEIALVIGERKAALDAAREAVDKSHALQAPAVEARALFLEARALFEDGQVKKADTVLEVARSRFVLARDRSGAARAQVVLSGWLSRRGEHQRAEDTVRAALAISREIGDRTGETQALLELGPQVWQQKGRAAGEGFLRRALEIARETGDRAGEADALRKLGIAFARSRAEETSMPLFRQSLAIYRALGNRARIGVSLTNLGRLSLLGGDMKEAASFFEEAESLGEDLAPDARAFIAYNLGYARSMWGDVSGAWDAFQQATVLFYQLGDAIMVDASVEALGSTALARGDVADAMVYVRASLSSRETRGEAAVRVARSKLVLSRVLLAAGQVGAAERFAREALEESQLIGARSVRPAAIEALALILLETDRAAEARSVLREMDEMRGDRKRWATINDAIYDLTLARVDAALGNHDRAAELATVLHRYFADRGAQALVLESEFVLLELEIRRTATVDEAAAQALEAAARAAGLELLARRVAALVSA